MRYFLQLLARLARHPSAFTSVCGTDTAGRVALEPPPEGGAPTKLYSTENSSSANRMVRPRQKTPDQIHDTEGNDFLYVYIDMIYLSPTFLNVLIPHRSSRSTAQRSAPFIGGFIFSSRTWYSPGHKSEPYLSTTNE